jgi:putative ABC transport system permease protein
VRGLSSFAWRSLAARRVRSLLTIAGIALGVGILLAALATNASIDRSVDRTVQQLVGRADLRIAAFRESGLSDATLIAVGDTPGVAAAAPQIERRTYLQPVLGAGPRPPVTILAIDPAVDGKIHEALPATALGGDADALISERLALDEGLTVGSQLVIQGAGAPLGLSVRGILPATWPVLDPSGRTVVTTLGAARQAFGPIGLSRIDLSVLPGTNPQAVAQELEQRLVQEPYVLSSPADLGASLRASTADFQATTALIAAVTLFVGAFLIFNTLSMTVGERFREVGLLRAAGTSRRQINELVLTQALILGALGSLLGVGLGWLLALVMAGHVRVVAAIPIDVLEVPIAGVVLAVLVGLLVTVAAALEPAWRAGRISPIEALRARPEQGLAVRARLRWLVVVFAVVAVVGLLLWPRHTGAVGLLRALAVYAVLLGATVASPFLLRPLGRLAGLPFGLLLRAESRLARGALVRDPSRTALTVGALTVGLAMIVALGGVALNARQAASSWLAEVIPGDEILTSINPIPLDDGPIAPAELRLPGVVRLTPIATFAVAYQGIRLDAAAVVGSDVLADGRLRFFAGDRTVALRSLDAGGTVILPKSVAERLGLNLGASMAFGSGGGKTADLRVAGIVERGLPGSSGEAVLVGWPDATTHFGVVGADFFAARFAAGEAGVAARPQLEATARQLALEPASLDRVQGAITDALGQVFGLFDALAVVAVIVAGLGIVNTLTMNVLERVREIGVLRAIGMTRRQVWRMVVVEAGVLGIVGAILGCLAGLAAGFLLLGLVAAGGLGVPLEVPWPTIVLAAIFGIAVAMLAAFEPARLASRISIVRAVQYE